MKRAATVLDPLAIIWGFALAGGLMLIIYAFASCCTAPQCPPPVQHLTTVMNTCELPPGPGKLPGIAQVGPDAGCPAALVCYDVPAAAAIAERNSKLVQWVRETKARCAAPSSLDSGSHVPVDSGVDAPAAAPAKTHDAR